MIKLVKFVKCFGYCCKMSTTFHMILLALHFIKYIWYIYLYIYNMV